MKLVQDLTGNGVKFLASSWSAPWWMKTNQQMQDAGRLLPNDTVWQAYANYIVKLVFKEF